VVDMGRGGMEENREEAGRRRSWRVDDSEDGVGGSVKEPTIRSGGLVGKLGVG